MSSTSETGHYKNVATFGRLVDAVATIDAYQPTRAGLQLGTLTDLFNTAEALMKELKQADAIYKKDTKVRATAFDAMMHTATRIYNSLAAADDNSPLLPAAKAHLDKLRGERRTELPKADEKTGITPETISVSQRSYDAQLDHLKDLVATVSAETAYQPNEADVSVAAINQLVEDLTGINAAAFKAGNALVSIREKRDEFFYDEHNGLVAIAHSVRRYLRGAFGAQSMEVKKLAGLRFTNLLRK
ncbi:hypothetical protein ACTHGU_13565 [Chitinophagaceae bacterium MMS25-I14]